MKFEANIDHISFNTFAAAGFSHAISTRQWGSLNPFVGYNFIARLAKNMDVPADSLVGQIVVPEEVHGARVHTCLKSDGGSIRLGVDALVARSPELIALVYAADCIPILLADTNVGAVAAIHAGRRGLLDGIVEAAVSAFTERGAVAKSDIIVGIGPALRKCCYEIHGDIFPELLRAGWMQHVHDQDDRHYLDLVAGCRHALVQAGISPLHIEDCGACTYCDPRFFSARRRTPDEERGASIAAIISAR